MYCFLEVMWCTIKLVFCLLRDKMRGMSQKKYGAYEPERCWVGEQQKVCYADQDEAEMNARLIETEHDLGVKFLHAYRCEYGEHWHLASESSWAGQSH